MRDGQQSSGCLRYENTVRTMHKRDCIRIRTDLCLAARCAVLRGDLEQTVRVELKGCHELSLATRHRGNASELKLAKQAVVAALRTLALVHREGDSRLVVLDSREDTGLVGGDGSVTGYDDAEDVALHGDTEGKGSNIEEEKVGGLVGGLASEDGSLDSSTVGNSFIGVDGLVELAATEVLRDQGLDLGDTRGTTDKDDVIDLLTGHLRILQHALNRVERGLKEGSVDLLETGTSDVRREVLTLERKCLSIQLTWS